MPRTGVRHREIADQVRTFLGAAGLYLILFGAVAAVWSARAAVAHRRYAALVQEQLEPREELVRARRTFRLYGRSYSLCIRAASTAFRAAAATADPDEAAALRDEADYWVQRGLDLNPWLMELRYIKSCLLVADGKYDEAVEEWRRYVDWHFWSRANHERLARFQEEADRMEEALETLRLLAPWPKYDEWRAWVEDEVLTRAAERPAPADESAIPAEPEAGPP